MFAGRIINKYALFLYAANHRTHRTAKIISRLLVGALSFPLY